MNIPNAAAGWLWIKTGFALFRKQPMEMLMLFAAYLFLSMLIGIIPIAGEVLPLILLPTLSMSFMYACRRIEQQQRVLPQLLLEGFHSPAITRLIQLGVLYLLAAILALGISALMDGGALWDLFVGKNEVDTAVLANPKLALGMLVAALVSTPAVMGFWYAAPLIVWQDMSVAKAVFYSFFAVKRAGKAFTVFTLAWFGIIAMVPTPISTLVALLFNSPAAGLMAVIPVYIVLTIVMYCSFYPSYTEVFEHTEAASPPL